MLRMKYFVLSFVLAALSAGCATPPQKESVVGDYLTGRFAANTNEIDAAATAFDGVKLDGSDSDQLLRSAFFYKLAAGDIDGATQFVGKILENDDPEDDDLARLALAARALKAGDYAQVRSILVAEPAVDYFSGLMTIIDAWAADGLKGPEAALKILAVQDAEMFREFHPLHQAFLFEELGLNDEARTAYQLSLMAYGGSVARDAYGLFLERTGDLETARQHYELLAQYPGPDRQVALHGLARLASGKRARNWTPVDPARGAAVALYSSGSAILQQTVDQRSAAEDAGFRVGPPNYDTPLAFTQIALYLDPTLDHAQRLAGAILNTYGDSENAIAMLKRIPATSAFYEVAQIEIASGFLALDRKDDAMSVLRTAAKPKGATEARFAYGNLLTGEARHREAVSVYSDLIDALPEDPAEDTWRYFVARAASLVEINNWPQAEADLKRAVEISPEEPTALNYLGYSWAERGENLDEAFALIENAVAIEPNSGAYIDSLGWAHFQRGEYEMAVGHLEHAASLEASDPTITDHLGDVYWRLGRETEARYQWRRVLELEPSDELRASAALKLKEGLPEAAK